MKENPFYELSSLKQSEKNFLAAVEWLRVNLRMEEEAMQRLSISDPKPEREDYLDLISAQCAVEIAKKYLERMRREWRTEQERAGGRELACVGGVQ